MNPYFHRCQHRLKCKIDKLKQTDRRDGFTIDKASANVSSHTHIDRAVYKYDKRV